MPRTHSQLLLAALVVALPAPAPENLIRNGDASSLASWTKNGPPQHFAHDPDVGAKAKGSLRLRKTDPADRAAHNWFQRVELPAKPPARLELTAFVRAESMQPGAEACVMVQVRPEQGDPLAYAWADKTSSDADWHETRAVFDVPAGARYVHVLAYLTGAGTVWFDDLALVETDEPVTATPGSAPAGDGPMEKLARGAAADLPWLFRGDEARAKASKERKPVLVYLRCTDHREGLDSARSSIAAEAMRFSDNGYAKDLLFRAGPLSSPEVRDLVARRTVPLCLTYELGANTYGADLPAGWSHTGLPGEVRFAHDPEEGGLRKGSLRIECTDATSKAAHNWRQSVKPPAGLPAGATLSARVRTQGFVDGSEACVLVNLFRGEQALGGGRLPEIRKDTKWKEQKVSFQIPEGCDSVLLLAYLVGAGTVWFDDLSLTVKGERGERADLIDNGAADAGSGRFEGFEIDPRKVTTPALVLADAKGAALHVLERIGTQSEDQVDHWLRMALGEAGVGRDGRDALAAYRDGQLARVWHLTRVDDRPADRALRARGLVRMGRLDEALEAVEGNGDGEADSVRGLVHLRRGEWREAAERYESAAGRLAGDAREETRFWQAWALAMLGERESAQAIWKELAGTSRAGRRAAACLLERGPRPLLAWSTVAWPRTEELPRTTEGVFAERYDLARSTAALLELQRPDGSFGDHLGIEGQGFTDPAITAIAADALTRIASKLPPELATRASASRGRALGYLRLYAEAEQPSFRAMDPFNAAYALRFLAASGEAGAARQLVARIGRLQLPDGNWTVYNPERPASFNTALCLLGLDTAARAGIDVPASVLESGLAALEAMRQSSGRFPYSTAPGHDWMTSEHGSIARDPLCEQALLAHGRGSREQLAGALERFLLFQHELRAPTKRLYDYFNERGHGGYYFFFAHRNALEAALGWTDPPTVERVRRSVRGSVLAAMEGDGTWMDSYLLGRAYGTAMALLVLE